jgi:hypothetical protein
MTVADLTYGLFTVFNGLRIFSYLPQILRVARDRNGASAISYATWSLWTAANATTGLYAAVNLSDLTLVVLNFVNAACCLAVIGLTMLKRRRLQPVASAAHFSETA